jgi:hypothetical protein
VPARIISEADVEKPVVKYARSKGVLVVKQTHAGARSHPDRAFYFTGGRLLQIEFKAPGKPPTILQAVTIEKLIELGFIVLIVDDALHGMNIINHYLAGHAVKLTDDNILSTIGLCSRVLDRKKQ